MKLTVDFFLSSELTDLPNNSVLLQLLKKATIKSFEMPLEALVCEEFGLQLAPDFPIAAISASVDGLGVQDCYWFRVDPVNFVMRRDCFSLDEQYPIALDFPQAELIIASLNQHFYLDGLVFFIGESGAWYLRLDKVPQIKTTLPNVVINKNIHQFLPQGLEALRWIVILNEIQMLLHEHPVNITRELNGLFPINSVWISGGGALPARNKSIINSTLLMSNSPFYKGLAKWLDLPFESIPSDVNSIIGLLSKQQDLRLQILESPSLCKDWFDLFLTGLKRKKIKQLILNFSSYEKTMTAEINAIDLYKFWRNNKSVMYELR